MKWAWTMGILFSWALAFGNPQPRGYFLADSVGLGEPVSYVLVFEYPPEWTVYFPDSGSSFFPFEWFGQGYQPTRILPSGMLYDSAVYQLLSFELDPYQALAVRVRVFREGDSTSLFTSPDTLVVIQQIPELSDTLQVKSNANPLDLPLQFNYPRLFWFLGVMGALVLVVLVFFGKHITRRILLWRLDRRHKQYQIAFRGLVQDCLKVEVPDQNDVEGLLATWKGFLEKISGHPYTKWTTREIFLSNENADVERALKKTDRLLYGKMEEKEWGPSLDALEAFAENLFTAERSRIKDGK